MYMDMRTIEGDVSKRLTNSGSKNEKYEVIFTTPSREYILRKFITNENNTARLNKMVGKRCSVIGAFASNYTVFVVNDWAEVTGSL